MLLEFVLVFASPCLFFSFFFHPIHQQLGTLVRHIFHVLHEVRQPPQILCKVEKHSVTVALPKDVTLGVGLVPNAKVVAHGLSVDDHAYAVAAD